MSKLNMPQKVPMLPGYIYNDPLRKDFHKTQQFSVQQHTNVEKTIFLEENIDPVLLDAMKSGPSKHMTYGHKEPPINDYIPRIQPPWLKFDRQVLRFAGYFQESVVESPTENYRLRKCLIYYYLNDETIQVIEPKTENSGMLQGAFLKRQKVPIEFSTTKESVMGQKNKDIEIKYFSWRDFKLGSNIQFYGRVFRITDCDQFTRNFYERVMGVDIGQSEKLPQDNFELLCSTKEVKINPPDTKEYKEYFEVKLGGGHPNDGLAQYLQNDRKVLSFGIYWDDNTLEGQTNFYTLNYFLADGTIEVKEVALQNNGKDPYPLLLNRMKVPKKPIFTHYPGMTLQKEEHYKPEDLVCGQTVMIYSRECMIYDCDPFTKTWYRQNMSFQQIPVPLKKKDKVKIVHPIPPYNGFGSEEDSLQNVFFLTQKAIKKDFNKMFLNDQYILRFEARNLSENKEENDQKYIVTFFCGDDTIQVYKLNIKNSGIQGGNFIQRQRHKNPETNQYYQQQEFVIGSVINLSVHQFQLIRMDDYTNNYMIENKGLFKDSDLDHIMATIKSHSRSCANYDEFLIKVLKSLDPANEECLTYEQVVLGFRRLCLDLSYQAVYTLMRKYENKQWLFRVRDFYEDLKKQ